MNEPNMSWWGAYDLKLFGYWDAERTLRPTRAMEGKLMTSEDVDYEMSFPKDRRSIDLYYASQAAFEHFVARYGATYEYIRFSYSNLLGDLSPLEDMPRLRGVCIGWNIRAERLWNLARTSLLSELMISNAKKLTCRLPGLEAGRSLQFLTIDGPTMDGNYPTDTFDVFESLPNLRLLTVTHVRPTDRSTNFLGALPALEAFNFDSGLFTTKEIAALCARYPHLGGWHMGPYHQWPNDDHVDISGKGKPQYLSLARDKARIERYVAKFKALVEAERNQL